MDSSYTISVVEADGNGYFTLRWSNLRKADRHDIRITVPARSGIYELYYIDERKRLTLFDIATAWYGGVRATLRAITDPEIEQDADRKRIISNCECYFRYSLSDSPHDMADVLSFVTRKYFPAYAPGKQSGRYREVFVQEISLDRIEGSIRTR